MHITLSQKCALFTCYILSCLLVIAGIAASFTQIATDRAPWLIITGAALSFLTFIAPKLGTVAWGDKKLELQSARIADEIVDKVGPQLQSIAESGTKWIDNVQAFGDAVKRIESLAEEAKGGSLELRLLAVAMSNSWDFVNGPLLDIVRNHRSISFTLRIAVMRSEYLSQFNLDTSVLDFAALSRVLPSKIGELKTRLKRDNISNFTVEAFYYEGFPQWHGLLVDGTELFLGRTDWDLETESRKPRLLCGTNDYRYFDLSTKDGKRRIKQFRHWFTFYAEYSFLLKEDARQLILGASQ